MKCAKCNQALSSPPDIKNVFREGSCTSASYLLITKVTHSMNLTPESLGSGHRSVAAMEGGNTYWGRHLRLRRGAMFWGDVGRDMGV
ncbi:hypothetical protein PM082_004494 [Marasmius tenuissimus]|nr:hypothetical protein PM082_004494 [Marasmius tenuissimus]